MEELVINPYLSLKAELLQKDREYECITWQDIGRASIAVANILFAKNYEDWHEEGLQLAQQLIRGYAEFIELLSSGELMVKKEV